MGQAREPLPDDVGVEPDGSAPRPRPLDSGTDVCPDCGHPLARHEGSPEDEFVASHGGVGNAFCLDCGCRTVIGSSPKSEQA